MDAHALLKELGFGDYEAKAYLGLLNAGECNGYETAKAAGIPRANVYAVLERLVERGAVQRLDTQQGVRYDAVPPAQLLAQLDQKHQQILGATRDALASLNRARAEAPVFNLRGADELIQRAQADIDAAANSLLVAIQPTQAAQLAESLRRARERGVTITTLCLEACAHECGGCQGRIHRLDVRPRGQANWLLVVADQSTALVGQFDGPASQGVATRQPLVIELTSAYIRQSLALSLLGNELAGRFEGLLSQQARSLLNELTPDGEFLARIQDLGKPASI